MISAANYTIEKRTIDQVEVYVLGDGSAGVEVYVAPSLGNNAYAMLVNGKNVIYWPTGSPAKATFAGNPLLWPWANRIDSEEYFANGKKYRLNPDLGNYRKDGNKQPIHGMLSATKEWKVVRSQANGKGAELTSRIEFWRYPEWMAQFPFAHNIEMTYRLRGGVLEVETMVENLSNQPLPLSLGYHPYFQLPDVPRDEWMVTLPAKERVVLSPTLVPTGAREPNPYPGSVELKGKSLDDVFTSLAAPAVFSVEGGGKKLEVEYGPKFPVAVVYAPPGRPFICFEPMTGITNAFNAAERGQYQELQTIPAGGKWQEVFRVKATGIR